MRYKHLSIGQHVYDFISQRRLPFKIRRHEQNAEEVTKSRCTGEEFVVNLTETRVCCSGTTSPDVNNLFF